MALLPLGVEELFVPWYIVSMEQEEQWRKRLEKTVYKDWYPEEAEIKNDIIEGVTENQEIQQEVLEYHGGHIRCAFVMTLSFDQQGAVNHVDGFMADEITVMEMLPFDEIKNTLAHYDPEKEYCLILVRNSEAVIQIIPLTL